MACWDQMERERVRQQTIVAKMKVMMILWKIGLQEWQAPIQSLEQFSDCVAPLRLWQYLVLLYLIKLLGMFTCLCVAQLISFTCRDIFKAMLVSAIIFLLPALLGLLQLDAVHYISLIPLLNANGILNGWIQGDGMLYDIAFVLLAAGTILCGGRYLEKVTLANMKVLC